MRSALLIWPPAPSCSITATLSPWRAANSAAVSPATPAPITTRSTSRMARLLSNRRPSIHGEALVTLTEKLDLRRAEPDEVLRRDGNRPIDAEDSDLEFVSRLDRIRQHHSIGHVEALDSGGAGIATAARHLAVNPDFRVVVDIRREQGFCVGRFEIADLRRYRQHRTVPDE